MITLTHEAENYNLFLSTKITIFCSLVAQKLQLLLISVYAELDAAGQFERMSLDVDEDEHSIEMHLPFIAKIMEEYDI